MHKVAFGNTPLFWEVLALPHTFMERLSGRNKAANATQVQNRASINDKQGLRLWSTLRKRALIFYRLSVVVFNTNKNILRYKEKPITSKSFKTLQNVLLTPALLMLHLSCWILHFLMYFLFQFLCLYAPRSSFSSFSFSPFTVILCVKMFCALCYYTN